VNSKPRGAACSPRNRGICPVTKERVYPDTCHLFWEAVIGKQGPGRGEPIGPLDWLRLLPHEAAASSDRRGWVGLDAARCRVTPAFELNLPALTRRRSKRQALLDAGATHVVATDEQDLVKEILGLTGGKGARVVFDPVGGPTMEKLVGATMPHGIVFIYGALSPEPTTVPALELVAKSIVLRGFWLAEITLDPTRLERLERGKRFVNEGLADGSLKPIIAQTFPLEEIVEAHRYLESNQQIGKVVVRV
jgi:D-arabinose 1-dehydrogenase-like Zn-dependent alcohol dehydrogenase